ASGGGRADYGMLPYADRVNRSDNADPIDVMLLHEGYSTLFVPKLAGGAGNVSPSPNYVNRRVVPLEYRVNSGMTGSMSVGVNLLKSDQAELDALRDAVSRFKQLRPALQDAYVYRIASANEHPYSVLQYTKRDRSQFTLFAFAHGMHQWDKQLPRFRMRGLDPNAVYVSESGNRLSGAALMNSGISLNMFGDYYSHTETWKVMD
ncbi:MAG: alpha-galactosidase, partial [Candidatus Flemingiibacterium sp.]